MKLILILLLAIVVLVIGFSIAAAIVAWLVLKWLCIVAFVAGFALVALTTGNFEMSVVAGIVAAVTTLFFLFRNQT